MASHFWCGWICGCSSCPVLPDQYLCPRCGLKLRFYSLYAGKLNEFGLCVDQCVFRICVSSSIRGTLSINTRAMRRFELQRFNQPEAWSHPTHTHCFSQAVIFSSFWGTFVEIFPVWCLTFLTTNSHHQYWFTFFVLIRKLIAVTISETLGTTIQTNRKWT